VLLEAEPAKVRPGRRYRTEARRAEALDLVGLYVGPLRVGGKSFDDAVELAGLAQLGHLAQVEQRPVGVLPIDTDGLDERQVFLRGFATVLDRPFHEHAVILQCCRLQMVDSFAPTSERRDPVWQTVRAGQELVAVRQAPTPAKLRAEVDLDLRTSEIPLHLVRYLA